ncbi:PIN domain-containing protein [Paraperlucidibaca wandonensis]|uniref:PIN domain-containing protein n=1 Tax=Paraperlucidibaca wandonensis TaxID=1268273 RepID=A0ABW3HIN9_9GAMM
MYLLISDANILIDLEEGQLLGLFFKLPYQFKVPDVLFHEELSERHGYLIDLGLLLGELTSDSMMYSFELRQKYSGPSMNDCFALALARQEQCPLLTGDMALRKAAEREAILVQGTIWVVEQLVTHRVLSIEDALVAYDRMAKAGRRLPWALAKQRLAQPK